MDMPVELMRGFFPDFFIPGLILIALEILKCAAFVEVWRRIRTDCLIAGLALGGLTVQREAESARAPGRGLRSSLRR